MTNLESLQQCPFEKRKCYVYMWLYKSEKGDIPFYVGIGTNRRYKDKSSRSAKFKGFLAKHECYPTLCATNLTREIARDIEKRIKADLKNRDISILDGEDSRNERKKRREEGIAAMPIVNGKRVSTKTGNEYGRPSVEIEGFEKFLKKQKDGELSVKECCEQLGISRATWYNKLKEVC